MILLLLVVVSAAASGPAAAGVPPPMPPPAYAVVGPRSRQLAYGSFAWAGGSADYGPPSARKDLPRIAPRRGQTVRFRLGFEPDRVTLTVGSRHFRLAATRTPAWRAVGGGLVVLEARLGENRATYLARLSLR